LQVLGSTIKTILHRDLWWLCTLLLRPKTWKLFLATCFCVIMVPADMLAAVMGSAVTNKHVRISLSLLLSWALLAWPFVTAFVLETAAERSLAVRGYWCVLLAFLFVSTIFALKVPEKHLSRRIVNPSYSVALTGANAVALLSIPLDALQLISLMVSSLKPELGLMQHPAVVQQLHANATATATSNASAVDAAWLPLESGALRQGVESVDRFADAVFLRVWGSDDAFLGWVWAVCGATMLSLCIVLAPVARLMVYRKAQEHVISNHVLYKTFVTLSAHTLSVFIAETLAGVCVCVCVCVCVSQPVLYVECVVCGVAVRQTRQVLCDRHCKMLLHVLCVYVFARACAACARCSSADTSRHIPASTGRSPGL